MNVQVSHKKLQRNSYLQCLLFTYSTPTAKPSEILITIYLYPAADSTPKLCYKHASLIFNW
jgi:hypothetical protein